jgi:hypothetical protein
MSRRPFLVGLTLSLLVHAMVGALLWRWSAQDREWPAPEGIEVDLARLEPEAPEPEPPARAETPKAPAEPPPKPEPAPELGPAPPPTQAELPWEPRPYPRLRREELRKPLRGPARHETVVADWWSHRSAVTYVETCRLGTAPRDSVLDHRITPEERILTSTARGLNENFLRVRRQWTADRIREAYRENFPLMQ